MRCRRTTSSRGTSRSQTKRGLGSRSAGPCRPQSLPELDDDRDMVRAQRVPAARPLIFVRCRAPCASTINGAVAATDLRECNASVVTLGPRSGSARCGVRGHRRRISFDSSAGPASRVDSAAPSHAMWELGRIAAASDAVSAAFDAGPDSVLDELRALDSPDADDFLERFDTFPVRARLTCAKRVRPLRHVRGKSGHGLRSQRST